MREWNRRLTQMGAEAEKLTRRHGDTEVQKEISHKDAQEAQDFQIINACRAVRYADMDRWTPGYTN